MDVSLRRAIEMIGATRRRRNSDGRRRNSLKGIRFDLNQLQGFGRLWVARQRNKLTATADTVTIEGRLWGS